MSYDNTNTGVLFKNERKQKENHPDYQGNLDVHGVQYSIAGWKRKSKNGKDFLSLKVEVQRENGRPVRSQREEPEEEAF